MGGRRAVKRVAALLRAVNVGGTGKLAMADLKRVLGGAGYDAPTTLLASGNAVFATASTAGLEGRLEALLAAKLGVTTEVMVRDGAELAAVLRGNPFDRMAKDDPARLVVLFLKGQPAAAGVAALRQKIVGREELATGERCLYIAYHDGQGTSKFSSAAIERALGCKGTARNFNTVSKLAEMTV